VSALTIAPDAPATASARNVKTHRAQYRMNVKSNLLRDIIRKNLDAKTTFRGGN
jgi:hypothetical protein